MSTSELYWCFDLRLVHPDLFPRIKSYFSIQIQLNSLNKNSLWKCCSLVINWTLFFSLWFPGHGRYVDKISTSRTEIRWQAESEPSYRVTEAHHGRGDEHEERRGGQTQEDQRWKSPTCVCCFCVAHCWGLTAVDVFFFFLPRLPTDLEDKIQQLLKSKEEKEAEVSQLLKEADLLRQYIAKKAEEYLSCTSWELRAVTSHWQRGSSWHKWSWKWNL